MATTYTMADRDLTTLLARTMAKRHPRLYDAGVRVGVLLAHNPDVPPIKHGGHPVLAKIKPVPLKDRLLKGIDAELVIDAAEYERLRERQKEALLSHELSHIDTIDRGEGDSDEDQGEGASKVTWKVDDLGRPKLKSVPGDFDAGDCFLQVISYYGDDAIEYEMLRRCKGRADRARAAGEQGDFDQVTDPPPAPGLFEP
jgi:hypothetical protein